MVEIDKDVYKAPLDEAVRAINQHDGKIKTYFNLETHTRELIFGNGNELLISCYENSVRLYDAAWSGIFPPSFEDVRFALRVIRESEKPLVFGCRAARERAGYLTAVYRMQVKGWDFDLAYAAWIVEGCRWPTYWLWKKALKKWSKQ